MDKTDIIQRILRASGHNLSLFSQDEIHRLQERIIMDAVHGVDKAKIRCVVRECEVQLKPEEIVRQMYAARLLNHYGYPRKRLSVEHPITFGRETKRADIVIFDKDRPDVIFMVVEVKKPKLKDGKAQLKSYCNAAGAPIGVWTNGEQISHYHRKDPNYFEDLTDIPNAKQKLSDLVSERFTLKNLLLKDKLANERKTLKDIVLEMEDEVLANAGKDVFEESFKLIFTKLYDEYLSLDDKKIINHQIQSVALQINEPKPPEYYGGKNYQTLSVEIKKVNDDNFRLLEFRNSGQTDAELKSKIQNLFERAQEKWPGVFQAGDGIELTESHLAVCVASLQDVKLFNSNLQVVDEAFEYLINKSAKGEKGQYFTPRHVIDMCVKMLNPKLHEYMIDPAAGSCGFPVHTIFHLTGNLFSNSAPPGRAKLAASKVFGIDFDDKAVRVARTLNLIAGDGETNVMALNSLDFTQWDDKTTDQEWLEAYGKGFKRLVKLRANKNDNKQFNFDIVMANPPFAGDIKEPRMLHQFSVGIGNNRRSRGRVARDVLFIERNLDLLKPGGRMAIVLPQGRFNSSDTSIRKFVSARARILAVVGLHGNTFKPHTGTKTSVLFVQKWDDEICPICDNYPIFFAVSECGGKNNSGDYIYRKCDNGIDKLDRNGHLIVHHDLHNHDHQTPDGIAEAFAQWAGKEGLSFWQDDKPTQNKFTTKQVNYFEKTYFDIDKVARLDAEYFQPKYEKIVSLIKSCASGWDRLGNLVEINKSVEVGSDEYLAQGIPFVRVSNLNSMEITEEKYISEQLYNQIKEHQPGQGEILFSKDATPGIAHYLSEDPKKMIPSSGILRLKNKNSKVNNEYLLLVLNSRYVKAQMNRDVSGSVILHWRVEQVSDTVIPILSDSIQTQIQEKVSTALQLQAESKRLFEAAERAVEIAIEESEAAAANYLKNH